MDIFKCLMTHLPKLVTSVVLELEDALMLILMAIVAMSEPFVAKQEQLITSRTVAAQALQSV